MDQVQGALLVVDDSEMNRDMLSRRLTRRGYRVSAAADGRQALDMVAAQSFDLILLDIMMPGLSGLDVLKTLRKSYTAAELPIIMATAKDQSEDIVTALRLGANDYITKPIDFAVALARIQMHLSLKRAMAEIQRLATQLEQRNRFIRQTFGRYLTDEVVTNLLDSPAGLQLGGEKRQVTMLMSDLRGFTALTERMAPEQVVTVLNRYLGTMTDVITRYQGTIDEFVGDGIFVIFGAPVARDDDAQRAVACALHMQIAMEGLNELHRQEGAPTFEMGIGIHTGEVVVGNIGSEKRKKYGVVGHAVNLTSRLESYTIGRQVLISEATWQALRSMVHVTARLDITAKGLTAPVAVYDVCGIGEPYNLMLPRRAETLMPLQTAVPLQYSMLSGKNVAATTFTGEFVKLSLQGGEVRATASIDALHNVQVRLLSSTGEPLPGTIYAKTVEALVEAQPGFRLHFTSISPEAAMVIQELLASDPSAS